MNRGSTARAYAGTDRRSFLATRNRANDGTDSSAATRAFGGLGPAAFADFVVFRRSDGIWNVVHDNLGQFKSQLGRTSDSAGFVNIGDTPADVRSARNHFNSALRDSFIQHGNESFANFVSFAVDAVDHANHNLGASRNCIAGVGCVGRRRACDALAAWNEFRIGWNV